MPDAPPVRPATAPRAQIVGTGLIGASIGLALRRRGWWVTGSDRDGRRTDAAQGLGAVDAVGRDADPAITFIATPAGSVVAEARRALEGPGAVTDVAGVKAPMAERIIHPRFVGGHPMAGSEQEGAEGADADLFVGATWVLCPTESTEAAAYTTVQSVVSSLGANVVALAAKQHDDVVALVSHVPHLTAATLMNLAADSAVDERTLLRLAAGGFRDMTRIAAGHPGIWPDICVENRDVILSVLDDLTSALGEVRRVIAESDRDGLLKLLERARDARVNLPAGVFRGEQTVEARMPVPDRPGVLAEVTTLLGSMAVNIYDLEIAHSAEGEGGVLVMIIDASAADAVREALAQRGHRASFRPLGP